MDKNPNQDPNLNSNPRPNPSDETPAQRLRRILASSQRKQGPQPAAQQDFPRSTPVNAEPEIPTQSQQPPLTDEELPEELPVGLPEEAPLQQSDTQPIPVIPPQQARVENSNSLITPREILQEIGQKIRQVFTSSSKKNRPSKPGKTAPRKKGKRSSTSPDRPPQKPLSCLLNMVIIGLFGVVAAGILALSFLIIQYFVIAANLPSVDDLRSYASQFQTTTIYDRDGSLIYEILDPNAGRRTYTTLDHISPALIAATIATEDKDFYTNPGFDPWGILRAFWQNYTHGEVVSGASTITQQLARALLLSPEERSQITTQRKAREIVLAAEITRRYSKDEILELYLNEIYYGNLAYGVEAAAETYFNVSAGQLDLAQASFLAGLPQAPAVYDIFTNRQAALLRHTDVLGLMTQLSSERGCISVNQTAQPVCVSVQDAVAAAQAISAFPFVQRVVSMPYPHWVNYIRAQLETQFDPRLSIAPALRCTPPSILDCRITPRPASNRK
jgi:Membrane carboxypeptidase/penicillin-binding protein